MRRARRALGSAPRPPKSPTNEARALVTQFLEAARSGQIEGFLGALAPDVVLMSDGGGQVPAVRQPLAGRSRVGGFFAGLSRKRSWGPVVYTDLNAQPAILIYQDDALTNALLLDITPAGITAIYAVRNPDKLQRLGQIHPCPTR